MDDPIPVRALGRSEIRVPALGVGTNRWGLRVRDSDRLLSVYSAALDAGANLFDSAEIYRSEKPLGECGRRDPRPAFVITKFAPYPTRLSSMSFQRALDGSLSRLGIDQVDLYLTHYPFSLRGLGKLMDWLAEVARAGKARAVGVSNFSARQMQFAAERLDRHGVPLAANEVQFSLFHRDPERNGILEACRKLDVALIAYRPLAGGRTVDDDSPLGRALVKMANAHQKTVSQVALHWLLSKDERIIAIPGATSAEHVHQNVGAVGWTLGDDELAELERTTA